MQAQKHRVFYTFQIKGKSTPSRQILLKPSLSEVQSEAMSSLLALSYKRSITPNRPKSPQIHVTKNQVQVTGRTQSAKRTWHTLPYPYIASSSGLGFRIVLVTAFG